MRVAVHCRPVAIRKRPIRSVAPVFAVLVAVLLALARTAAADPLDMAGLTLGRELDATLRGSGAQAVEGLVRRNRIREIIVGQGRPAGRLVFFGRPSAGGSRVELGLLLDARNAILGIARDWSAEAPEGRAIDTADYLRQLAQKYGPPTIEAVQEGRSTFLLVRDAEGNAWLPARASEARRCFDAVREAVAVMQGGPVTEMVTIARPAIPAGCGDGVMVTIEHRTLALPGPPHIRNSIRRMDTVRTVLVDFARLSRLAPQR